MWSSLFEVCYISVVFLISLSFSQVICITIMFIIVVYVIIIATYIHSYLHLPFNFIGSFFLWRKNLLNQEQKICFISFYLNQTNLFSVTSCFAIKCFLYLIVRKCPTLFLCISVVYNIKLCYSTHIPSLCL